MGYILCVSGLMLVGSAVPATRHRLHHLAAMCVVLGTAVGAIGTALL